MQKIGISGILILTSLVIAYFFGRKRQIGFWWSLFFCIFLNPIIGLIITLISKKYNKTKPKPSLIKKIIGQFLTFIFAIALIGAIGGTINEPIQNFTFVYLQLISFQFGFLGLGIYLIELGNGNVFNKKG
jgi:hypothetical protein